jgi:hypothetical protein
VLGISVLEDTFRAEHFLVTLAKEFYFLVFMNIAILNASILSSRSTLARVCVHLSHGQGSQNCIIDGKVVSGNVMCDLIEGTFNNGMFVYLFQALEAECVPAWQRQGLFLRVIVLFETHTTFKYRIHSF